MANLHEVTANALWEAHGLRLGDSVQVLITYKDNTRKWVPASCIGWSMSGDLVIDRVEWEHPTSMERVIHAVSQENWKHVREEV
jgi:hypothetical protein